MAVLNHVLNWLITIKPKLITHVEYKTHPYVKYCVKSERANLLWHAHIRMGILLPHIDTGTEMLN